MNTKCMTCSLKKICKHYQYFKNNDDIVVEVIDCDNNKDQAFKFENTVPVSTMAESKLEIPQRAYPNLNSNVALLDTKAAAITAPSNMSVTPVSVSKATCSRCGTEVLSTEADNCNECHRTICYNCSVATVDKDTGSVVTTCEKCWSGAPDPDPDEDAPVKISYGDENSEWNLKDFVEEEKVEVTDQKEEESKNVKKTRPAKSNK